MSETYKRLKASFWQDNFVVRLNLEEKLFYTYLLTNSRCNHCGIYSFSILFATIELGLSEEKIKELIDAFCRYKKILYDEVSEEIMIINWYKYNVDKDAATLNAINLELQDVKNKEFVKNFYSLCKDRKIDLDTLFDGIPINKGFINKDMPSEDLSNKVNIKNLDSVLDAFNNNIHTATLMEIQELRKLCDNVGDEIVILAITEAVNSNIKNLRYIKGIIYNWKAYGLKSAEDVKNYLSNKEKNKVKS